MSERKVNKTLALIGDNLENLNKELDSLRVQISPVLEDYVLRDPVAVPFDGKLSSKLEEINEYIIYLTLCVNDTRDNLIIEPFGKQGPCAKPPVNKA